VKTNLKSFSWNELTRSLEYYRDQYIELERVKTFALPDTEVLEASIDYSDLKNIFIFRMLRDIRTLDRQVQVVNNEIARRRKLIGVMG